MPNPSNYFQIGKRFSNPEGKNKENDLSFRNIAVNGQHHSHASNCLIDGNFKAMPSQLNPPKATTDYSKKEHSESCFNHPSKHAQYFQPISQSQFCRLCAARLASLGIYFFIGKGHALLKLSIGFIRETSQIQNRQLSKKALTNFRQIKQELNSKTKCKPTVNSISKLAVTATSKKHKTENLQQRHQESQQIVEGFVKIYSEKMDRIQDLINGLRIKDIQYANQIKNQNNNIYQQACRNRETSSQNSCYDLLGNLILETTDQNIKFNLPSEEKIERLVRIQQIIEDLSCPTKSASYSQNKVPLIKSISSNSSQNNQNFQPKSSSSVSNLSGKSNFKKQKKQSSIKQKFGSQISKIKHFKTQQQIQSSRFSSTSAVIKTKNNKLGNQLKTQSSENKKSSIKRGSQNSNSCQDTPQSIKSKISANSFVLPKNIAVTMFEKINVCESIEVKPSESYDGQSNANSVSKAIQTSKKIIKNEVQINRQTICQSKSSYTNKSENKSMTSKGCKSFNRYQNIDPEE